LTVSVVEQYYDANTQHEWERLSKRHPIEFAVTLRAFAEYLPQPPARVIDVGGGPGRYAIALAQQGYEVTLLDLAQNNLSFARARAQEADVELASYVHGNALDLSTFPEAGYDVVLLMGPLYHLTAEADRCRAVREALRVLKPGGVLCAAFITRYAAVRDAAKRVPAWICERAEDLRQLLQTGVLANHDGGFTLSYSAHPSEVGPFFAALGLHPLALIAAEGLIAWGDEAVNATSGEVWDAWVALNYQLGKDPSVHGAAAHLLYLGMKDSGSQQVIRLDLPAHTGGGLL
jgi:S-adenosylmethionine-dependent methyltransferase